MPTRTKTNGITRAEVIESLILDACRRAEAQGFTIRVAHCGLMLRGGVYVASDAQKPTCLPLEAILLGKRSTGFLTADIERELKVSPSWVAGFYAGFTLCKEVDPASDGYLDGLRFRTKHYRSEESDIVSTGRQWMSGDLARIGKERAAPIS